MERLDAEQIGLEYADSLDPRLRRNAASFLAEIGTERALETVVSLLKDPDEGVRDAATAALLNGRKHSISAEQAVRQYLLLPMERLGFSSFFFALIGAATLGFVLSSMRLEFSSLVSHSIVAGVLAFASGMAICFTARPIGAYPSLRRGIVHEAVWALIGGTVVGAGAFLLLRVSGAATLGLSFVTVIGLVLTLVTTRLGGAFAMVLAKRRLLSRATIITASLVTCLIATAAIAHFLTATGILDAVSMSRIVITGLPCIAVAAAIVGTIEHTLPSNLRNIEVSDDVRSSYAAYGFYGFLALIAAPYFVSQLYASQQEAGLVQVNGRTIADGAEMRIPYEMGQYVHVETSVPLRANIRIEPRREDDTSLQDRQLAVYSVVDQLSDGFVDPADLMTPALFSNYNQSETLAAAFGDPETFILFEQTQDNFVICAQALNSRQSQYSQCESSTAIDRRMMSGVNVFMNTGMALFPDSKRMSDTLSDYVLVVDFPGIVSAEHFARDARLAREWVDLYWGQPEIGTPVKASTDPTEDPGDDKPSDDGNEPLQESDGEGVETAPYHLVSAFNPYEALPGSVFRDGGSKIWGDPYERAYLIGGVVDSSWAGQLSWDNIEPNEHRIVPVYEDALDCAFVARSNAFRRFLFFVDIPVHPCDAFVEPLSDVAAPEQLSEWQKSVERAVKSEMVGSLEPGFIANWSVRSSTADEALTARLVRVVGRTGQPNSVSRALVLEGNYDGGNIEWADADNLTFLPNELSGDFAFWSYFAETAFKTTNPNAELAETPPMDGDLRAIRERTPLNFVGHNGQAIVESREFKVTPGFPIQLSVQVSSPINLIVDTSNSDLLLDAETNVYGQNGQSFQQVQRADDPPNMTLRLSPENSGTYYICVDAYGSDFEQCPTRASAVADAALAESISGHPVTIRVEDGSSFRTLEELNRAQTFLTEQAALPSEDGNVQLLLSSAMTETGFEVPAGFLMVLSDPDPRGRQTMRPLFQNQGISSDLTDPEMIFWPDSGDDYRTIPISELTCPFVRTASLVVEMQNGSRSATTICDIQAEAASDAVSALLDRYLQTAKSGPKDLEIGTYFISYSNATGKPGLIYETLGKSEYNGIISIAARPVFGPRSNEVNRAEYFDQRNVIPLSDTWDESWLNDVRALHPGAGSLIADWTPGAGAPDKAPYSDVYSQPRCPEGFGRETCLIERLSPGDQVVMVDLFDPMVPTGSVGTYYGAPEPEYSGEAFVYVVWDEARPNGCFFGGFNGSPDRDDRNTSCVDISSLDIVLQ